MTTLTQPRHAFEGPNVQVSDWIADQFAPGYRGYCIDVGASDGMSTNSTFMLEKMNLWTVLSVEANAYFKDKLEATRGLHRICAVSDAPAKEGLFHIHLNGLESFSSLKPREPDEHMGEMGERWASTMVPITTLDELLLESKWPRLDALCMDTEGTEKDVLAGLDVQRWRPRVIITEAWAQGELDDVLIPLGYERVLRHAENDGYIYRPWGLIG